MRYFFSVVAILLLINGCSPEVKVQVPDKPVEVDIKVDVEEHEAVKPMSTR